MRALGTVQWLASPARQRWLAAALLLAFTALCVHGVWRDSPTVDEFAHVPAGLHYLETGSFALFATNPPLVKVLSALPLLALDPAVDTTVRVRHNSWFPFVYATEFMERNRARYETLFTVARLPVVGLGVLLGALVFVWARRLHGPLGGLLAVFLYSFCPTLVAHAHLATIDVGHAFFLLLAVFAFERYVSSPAPRALLLAGIALGLALLAKFTAVILLPLLALLGLVMLLRGHRFSVVPGLRGAAAVWGSGGAFVVLVATSLLTVNLGYLFEGSGTALGAYQLQSAALGRLRDLLPGWLPVPLPVPFVYGFDGVQLINELGENPNYLLGEWSARGWSSYYLVALLVKTPLPFLGLVLLAFLGSPRHREAEVWVWLPVVVLLTWFSLFSRVQYGVRYVLPVLPLACVYAGRLVPILAAAPARVAGAGSVAVAALLALYPVPVLAATPDTIDYFNPLAGERPDDVLLDSNLDWGQGLERLRAFMERRDIATVGLAYFGHVDPRIYGIDARWPRREDERPPEYVASSVNFLRGYPFVTYRDGRITPVAAGEVAWIGELPLVADLGGGLRVYRRTARTAPPVSR